MSVIVKTQSIVSPQTAVVILKIFLEYICTLCSENFCAEVTLLRNAIKPEKKNGKV